MPHTKISSHRWTRPQLLLQICPTILRIQLHCERDFSSTCSFEIAVVSDSARIDRIFEIRPRILPPRLVLSVAMVRSLGAGELLAFVGNTPALHSPWVLRRFSTACTKYGCSYAGRSGIMEWCRHDSNLIKSSDFGRLAAFLRRPPLSDVENPQSMTCWTKANPGVYSP